ncbi:MAG: LPS export ABC transporter permease LptF [Paracoccaceae bacterium]|nr:MAG: LPS export ABC transporter permease LptF [Paracoccaceae bacterium]
MSRFDRYLTAQYLTLFGFFALILVMVYWVNRAVGLFDRLIGDGQSARVFLEFSLLTLPNVVRLVLPVAAFAAAVHVTNRLSQDGELVVMRATGFSAWRLARPVMWFGATVAVMMLLLMHLAVPASRAMLAERSAEIEANATARLLSDGRFMHPSDGLTFYIREIAPSGELRDIFLSDDRAPGSRITYTARRALLARGESGAMLIMFEGMTQELANASGRLSVTHFADLTYDLSGLLTPGTRAAPTLDELTTPVLIAATPEMQALTGQSAARMRAEVHARIAQPFLAPAAALIGFAALMLGAFSRFGLWRQILFAIVLLIAVQMVNNAASGASLRNPDAWMLAYAAPVLGIGMGCALLWLSERPRRVRRPPAGAAEARA